VKKRNWIVKVECIVTKEIYCNGCTQEQALADPFDFAVDEREIGQDDWTVQSIQPNE